MSNRPVCELCGAPLPPRRRKYDSRRHAVHAAVLRYRKRHAESYRQQDATRKRLARYGEQLRSEVSQTDGFETRWHGASRAGSQRMTAATWPIRVKRTLGAMWEEYVSLRDTWVNEGPIPELLARAAGLWRRLRVMRPHRELGDFWRDCAWLYADVGERYDQRHSFHSFLKELELFELEQRNYSRLAQAQLRRISFSLELAQDPCDRLYDEAIRLDRHVTVLLDGPLRGVWPLFVLPIRHRQAVLRLRLAAFRKDFEGVRVQYETVENIASQALGQHVRVEPETYFEGIYAHILLGDLLRAERSLSAASRFLLVPGAFHRMRLARAKARLLIAQGDVEAARLSLTREFRPLCDRYRSWSDVRFWQAVASRLGLPPMISRQAEGGLALVPEVHIPEFAP